jgi:hypothetical protein
MTPLFCITTEPHGVDARDKRGHDARVMQMPPSNIEVADR